MQKTLAQAAQINGIGLHSNCDVALVLKPAAIDHGVVFKRVDGDIDDAQRTIPALWNNVVNTQLCSVIGNEHGMSVSTIEHLMAALRASGIDNVLIEINADEVPILDGSSKPFMDAIEQAGTVSQNAPRKAIRILRDVVHQDGNRQVTLSPSAKPVYEGMIDYDNPTIGAQTFTLSLTGNDFNHDVSDCRTFCLKSDIDMMRAHGRALGGSLDNAVVVDDNGVMNEEGLRCETEFVRHKVLDAVGDLALSGGLILGHYKGQRAGHEMNNKLLHAVFADERNYEMVDLWVEFETEPPISYGQAESVQQTH